MGGQDGSAWATQGAGDARSPTRSTNTTVRDTRPSSKQEGLRGGAKVITEGDAPDDDDDDDGERDSNCASEGGAVPRLESASVLGRAPSARCAVPAMMT
eukprot:3006436-Rhodomonas_salina.1